MSALAVVSDLIFESRITAVAAALDVPVRIARSADAALPWLGQCNGVLLDLNLAEGDPLALLKQIKGEYPGLPVIGFLSHVQVDLRREAQAAGADTILPRSKFVEQLPTLLETLRDSRLG